MESLNFEVMLKTIYTNLNFFKVGGRTVKITIILKLQTKIIINQSKKRS